MGSKKRKCKNTSNIYIYIYSTDLEGKKYDI